MTTGDPARAYHEATKHSHESVHRGGFGLDWGNKPAPLKVYSGLPRVPLPREAPPLGVAALEAAGGAAQPVEGGGGLDAAGLGRLLWLGAGAHRPVVVPGGGVMHFRTYASAGALYPNEVYVVCERLGDLPAGVYHLDPAKPALTRLREGDHRGFVARATAGEPAASEAPVLLVLTGIPWRTAWKYAERGYRHLFWDGGMIAANLLALARGAGLPARVILGFVDAEIEKLLGLDARTEFPLCLIAVGGGSPVEGSDVPASISAEAEPLSPRVRDFPAILEVNDAGRLDSGPEVARWRESRVRKNAAELEGGAIRPKPAEPSSDSLETVIRRRGSARVFGPSAIPAGVLEAILGPAVSGIATDYAPRGSRLTRAFLIANAVDGLPAGSYAYQAGGFRRLRDGEFRRKASFMCLEQRLAGDAAAVQFLLSDLDTALDAFGGRGYRAAQLEAGIVAGTIYLRAYAYRWGATGLTFYDDEIERFFSPEARGLQCMLVVCVGESSGRPSLRPIR